MNGKKAKLLRKAVGFKPSDVREYKDTVIKTVMVRTTSLGEDGNAIMKPEPRIVRSSIGLRKAYKGFKLFLKRRG